MASAPSAPTPPNPADVAQQQTLANKATAGYQAALNDVNQVTPGYSLNYNITGYDPQTGAPIRTATETLSPQLQSLFNTTTGAASNLMGNVEQAYSQAPNINPSGAINQAMAMQQQYLQPWFTQQQNVLNSNLEGQGLAPGDAAYDLAEKQLQETQTQSMEGNLATFEPIAFNQEIQSYELPAQTVGMLEGLQPQTQPINPPQTGVSPTDVIGAYQNYQQAQMAAYQAQMQNYSAKLGGLFSIPSALAGGWARGGFAMPSDRRLKRDIRRIGQLANGLAVYLFRYLWSDQTHLGLMADEVERVHPEAVFDMGGGYKAVDYGLVVL
jgi:hypothetical protein